MNNKNFTGYVLSGGKSSRMGTDKAFLKIGTKTFLENTADALRANCEQVKIVLNKSQKHFIEKLPADFPYIFDIHENRGAPGGIHAALSDCKTEFAIILAVDLPNVTSDAIKNLSEIAINSQSFSAFVPRQDDRKLQPLCAVYRTRNCLPKIEELLTENDSVSVRDFLQNLNIKIISAENLGEKEDLLANINFPQDLFEMNN